MIKRILVALSGTPYTPVAVEHALELAATHGAEITGVTVTDLQRLANVGPVPVGAGAAAHSLTEHRILVTEESEAALLFDYRADPLEQQDLADGAPEDRERLREAASRYQREVRSLYNPEGEKSAPELGPGLEQQLRGLGYID